MRRIGHALLILLLTLLTQTGGLAWLAALFFRRHWIAFPLIYCILWGAVFLAAPQFGREPLPCLPGGTLQSQSVLYCAMNRHYVTPELAELARDAADEMARRHPGTVTLTLDAGFPFVTGFPLLPHLSHDDGRKLDFALYYRAPGGSYLPAQTRSPIGYFAFEQGPSSCPPASLTLRWDLDWLQQQFPDRSLDHSRTAELLRILAGDPRVKRIFVEPHLADRLGVAGARVRFQGCRAARHDDHIHVSI